MGEYAKAEPLYQEALRIRQKVLGPEHPYTALSLNNLGSLYWAIGEYAKAEPLLQEALRIRQKVLGPEHPETATSLYNLGSLYQSMGEYAKAEPLYQEALRIRQKVLGPEHPDTANSLENLAMLLLNDRLGVTKSKFFKNPMHRSGLACLFIRRVRRKALFFGDLALG